MLNLTSPRALAALQRARAHAQAVDRMRQFADRIAAAKATRDGLAHSLPADDKQREPVFWILHAR